jgi:hypothetical protein
VKTLWIDRTDTLRRLLSGFPAGVPLPAGTVLRLYDGKATGHGNLSAGTPILQVEVGLSGMLPEKLEYHEDSYLHHRITDGVASHLLYWDGKAGGWMSL